MKYFLSFCFFYVLTWSYCQNHQLIDTTDYEKHKLLIETFKDKNEKFNQDIKSNYKGKLRKEILGIYTEYQSHLNEILENKKLLFDSRFGTYLDSLFNTLVENNPDLKDENIKVFLSKEPSPNAFSIGNGTIVTNIGLFCSLENEYQLLSVIAHEAAHELLKHSHNSIVNQSNLNVSILGNNSKFSRNLKLHKYNKGAISFEKLKNLLYEEGEIKRQNEIAADSLGYLLYKNCNVPKKEFLNALITLQKYDSVPSIALDSSIYFKTFDLPELPFNKAWMKNEDFNAYNYNFYKEKIDKDSIKDHPEIENRVVKLKQYFKELDNKAPKINTIHKDSIFIKLQRLANKAYVENLFYSNEYGLSIYLILKRLENNFDDIYLKKWLGINFNAIYEAKKKYQLNRYVERVVPKEQSKSYQQFLNFIWNLKLSEIKAIAEYYSSI
ncbi:M48 family metalloprotease [Jejuia pallidilutea]|uniref:Peptidase n=1 Tax=Jejuia pallidilutea TaxID=504487 RepID=A0A090VPA4_9FLAO|nr:M48 family metalloprotease [Jejuia pallidilutea]GAL66560.1 peptidase [Jejuia pallidilutea]GAL69818.1 peptidase M48 family [Jejuia pallidilutea]GAL90864.1 peptidase M48 family [Jejuia pallidilutea]